MLARRLEGRWEGLLAGVHTRVTAPRPAGELRWPGTRNPRTHTSTHLQDACVRAHTHTHTPHTHTHTHTHTNARAPAHTQCYANTHADTGAHTKTETGTRAHARKRRHGTCAHPQATCKLARISAGPPLPAAAAHLRLRHKPLRHSHPPPAPALGKPAHAGGDPSPPPRSSLLAHTCVCSMRLRGMNTSRSSLRHSSATRAPCAQLAGLLYAAAPGCRAESNARAVSNMRAAISTRG